MTNCNNSPTRAFSYVGIRDLSLVLLTLYFLASFIRNPELVGNYSYISYAIILFSYAVVSILFLSISSFRSFSFTGILFVWVLFCAYMAATSAWSNAGYESIFKTLAVLAMLIATAGFSQIIGAKIFTYTYIILTFLLVISAVVAIASPEIGQEAGWRLDGDWRGLAGQKNMLGLCAVVALVLSIAHYNNRKYLYINIFLSLFSVLILLLSDSRGATASAIVIVLYFSMRKMLSGVKIPSNSILLPLLVATAIIVAILPGLEVNGKFIIIYGLEINTAGRMDIWNYALLNTDNVLFGSGLEGFWDKDRELDFFIRQGWHVPNFHNGYVATFVEGGLLGLIMLALLCIGMVNYIARSFTKPPSLAMDSTAGLFLLYICINLTEDMALRSTSILSVLVSIAVFTNYRRNRVH